MTKKKDSQTYQKMLEEVEDIVKDVGDGNVDLDEMVKKIEHGYGLIKTMRSRLDETREKIDKLRDQYSE